MKNFYDVAKSSSLKHQTPRIVQIHLKCKKTLENDESSGLNEVSFSTSLKTDSQACNDEEPQIITVSDNSKDENLIITEQSLTTTNSGKSFDENFLRRSIVSESKNLEEEDEESSTHKNITYWLSFPTAMRNALRYSGSFSKEQRSITDIQYNDSIEDLSLPIKRASNSAGIFRNNSLRRSFRSRSVKLVSENLSTKEIWPRGQYSLVKEKQEIPLWRNSYEIKWKEENIVASPKSVKNNEPNEKKETSITRKWKIDKLAHKKYYDSPEVRNIYGFVLNDSPKRKSTSKLVPTCCV